MKFDGNSPSINAKTGQDEACGVRYLACDRQDRMVTKERFFKSFKARTNWLDKAMESDGFVEVISFWQAS